MHGTESHRRDVRHWLPVRTLVNCPEEGLAALDLRTFVHRCNWLQFRRQFIALTQVMLSVLRLAWWMEGTGDQVLTDRWVKQVCPLARGARKRPSLVEVEPVASALLLSLLPVPLLDPVEEARNSH